MEAEFFEWKWTTTNRRTVEISTTYSVFSLDRKCACDDTATPDSGNVDAPHGPSRGETKVRVNPLSGPGSKRKKTEREVPAPRP